MKKDKARRQSHHEVCPVLVVLDGAWPAHISVSLFNKITLLVLSARQWRSERLRASRSRQVRRRPERMNASKSSKE